MQRATYLRVIALLAVVVGMSVLWYFLPVGEYAEKFRQWVEERGQFWGLVVLAAAYTPAILLFFPGSLLSIGAGAVFGIVPAVIAISIGSTSAACVGFWVGRRLARTWVEEKVAGNQRFQAIDRAVGRSGFKIVLWTRLSPAFPFTLLSYSYGLTKVSFRDYFWASWMGMLPGTVLYVSIGHAAKRLAVLFGELAEGRVSENLLQLGLVLFIVATTLTATVIVTRVARRALRTAMPEGPSNEPEV